MKTMFHLVRYGRYASRFGKVHYATTITTSTDPMEPARSSPPPIRVTLTESAGRGVFATRRIGAGELIHTAKPFITHPSISLLHSVCYFCLKKLENRNSCSISFCSDYCKQQAKAFYEVEERANWSSFNDYCRFVIEVTLLTHSPTDHLWFSWNNFFFNEKRSLKYPFLVKRLACMVISGVVSTDSLDILQSAILSSEMISLMEKEFCLLRKAFLDANIMDEKISFLTMQWYANVLARIRINAFRVEVAGGSYEDLLLSAAASVDAEAALGNAVYILPSLYNHDCDPNAHILWIENANARLKALRDIEAGEELRICYIDASMDYDARQTLLYEGFGFRCTCLRCLSTD